MSLMLRSLITVVTSRTYETEGYSCFHFLPKGQSPEDVLMQIPSEKRLLIVQTYQPPHFNIGTGTPENVLKAHKKALIYPTFPDNHLSDFQRVILTKKIFSFFSLQ